VISVWIGETNSLGYSSGNEEFHWTPKFGTVYSIVDIAGVYGRLDVVRRLLPHSVQVVVVVLIVSPSDNSWPCIWTN